MAAELGIIGGYLGSGKSTLINRLLGGALPGRTAVVVNDFGDVNIDAELVASSSEDTIELTNGCICCQITDDVARTMTALAGRDDLDRVLCEVSGVGDPRQLASWRHYPGFSPGPILVCADATAIGRLLRSEYVADTVRRQLGAADVVLVTKTDLAMAPEIDAASAACAEAAPAARMIQADPEEPDASARTAFTAAVERRAGNAGGSGADGAGAWADDHARTHATRTVEGLEGTDLPLLARALQAQAPRLVRAKGILRDVQGQWHDLQLSGGRVDLTPHRVAGSPRAGTARSRLVIIAAGPQAHDDLRAAAAALRAVPPAR